MSYYHSDAYYNNDPKPRASRTRAAFRGFLDPDESSRADKLNHDLANEAERLDRARRDASYEAARQREGRLRANDR
ncbi:MAG: hypothetical protein Q9174_006540, partial [Haloplaca sp. 1 TL-2023]